MTNSNSKGARRERQLVDEFYDHDYAVMRAPASGSATERELPDVLAGNVENFYAVELKASEKGEKIYLDREEVEALVFFAANFGAEPKVVTRYDYDEFRFIDPWECHCTPSGKSYRVSQELAESAGVTFDELP